MSRLSDLAAFVAADKRQAEELSSYILASRELAHELSSTFSSMGVNDKSAQIANVAQQLSAAENERWLTAGHLEDAIMVINSAMAGNYSGAAGSGDAGAQGVIRTNFDGSQTFLTSHGDADVSLKIADSFDPPARTSNALTGWGYGRGETTESPNAVDPEEEVTSRSALRRGARTLVRKADGVKDWLKTTGNARVDNTAEGFDPHKHTQSEVGAPDPARPEGRQTQGGDLDGEALASLVLTGVVAVEGFSRLVKERKPEGK